MSAIDDIVDLLKDGEWHTLKDLAENLKLNPEKLQEIVQFLEDLDLIKIDNKQQRALINPDLKQLITLEEPKQTP